MRRGEKNAPDPRRRASTLAEGKGGPSCGAPAWSDEASLLAHLAEQQTALVSDTLERAARSERLSRRNKRLARDLEGSLDRIQEVHHRVRNHLQALTGLLSAQEVAETSPGARQALQKSIGRLTSIAAIHDLLARDPRSGELRLPTLAERLARDLIAQAGAEGRLRTRVDVAPISLAPREATAVVLILTELLSNAVEHAFPGQAPGEIAVSLTAGGGKAALEVRDTGVGLPQGFDLAHGDSLGLRLVARLAQRDLRGQATARTDGGACFRILFPVGRAGGRA